MNPSVLEKIEKVITHANCPDGIASALIIRAVLDVPVKFITHESHRHLTLEPGKYLFVDFAPHRARWKEFKDSGAVILDHHIGSKDILEKFGDQAIYGEGPGVSGATLAYEHVWRVLRGDESKLKDRNVKLFAELIAIRDTWIKDHPRWQEACAASAALLFYGFDYLSRQDRGEQFLRQPELDTGNLILQKRLERCKDIERNRGVTLTYGSFVFFVFNDSEHDPIISDLAEHMRTKGHHVVIGFYYVDPHAIKISVRSDNTFNANDFCSLFGGGGHARAAGAVIEMGENNGPFEKLNQRIQQYICD